MSDIFKCGLHDFSTSDITEWDKHCEENDHEYDLHTQCDCGKPLHIKPKQKLGSNSKRIPKGHKCKKCKKIVTDAPEIKEAGEIING